MDWKSLQATLTAESKKAITDWMAAHTKHHVYAVAFHQCYREFDGEMHFPLLGINSLELLQQKEPSDGMDKWNPADWSAEDILTAPSPSLTHQQIALIAEATHGTQAHWRKTEQRFLNLLVQVVKTLRRDLSQHNQTTQDFVVYLDGEGREVLRKCVPKTLFEKHWAALMPPAVEAGETGADQLQEYLSSPYQYDQELLTLGEDAVDGLLGILDGKDGSYAASLLSEIGSQRPEVLSALRSRVRSGSGVGESCACALAKLGDMDYLMKLVGDPVTQVAATTGIVSLLLGSASKHPLDYRPVEQLLALDFESVTNLLRDALRPGCETIMITPADINEAICGCSSRYEIIRQHAVSVLGNRGLGKAAGKVVLPALVQRLTDESATVRRLTLLSLSYWKAAAKPYHEEMRKRLEDRDGNVRSTAGYVLFG